jgi:CheY-like chemotaxis protein
MTAFGSIAYLSKPVRAQELLDCMSRLFRGAQDLSRHAQGVKPATAERSLRRGRALVVEDNLVNQKVASRFLDRLGFEVVLAEHGEQGVQAYEREHFDVVFMDLQMPVMDGITATRRIRDIEIKSGRRTPIIALTANAMVGQLERCLSAGMDAFLAKPIEVSRLRETLEQFGLGIDAADAPAQNVAAVTTPIDLEQLRELVGEDQEFGRDLVATFAVSGAQVLAEMESALRTGDRKALARAAHKLKGASANIHATPLRELAHTLEQACESATADRLQQIVAATGEQFRRAEQFLRSLYSAAA